MKPLESPVNHKKYDYGSVRNFEFQVVKEKDPRVVANALFFEKHVKGMKNSNIEVCQVHSKRISV